MKSLTALLSLFISLPALASVQSIVNPSKATIIIQGPAGDMDAPNLFNALNVPANDTGSTLNKKIQFKSAGGESLFDLGCNISKTIMNFGSCTLVIFKSELATIDTVKSEVFFMVSANQAWDIIRKFQNPDNTGNVFHSNDLKLGIKVDNAGTGTESLRIWLRK